MTPVKILIVEDEGVVGLFLQEALIELGYDVIGVFSTGEEALQQIQSTPPQLIFMDIHLAGELDGVTAAAEIQAAFDIPIVYLTAYTDDATIERAKRTAPFGYLVKPFEVRELHTTIEMALYKHAMNAELKAREQWLQTVLRSIGDAVVTTDAQGVVTFMNPVAEALTQWPQAEALGQQITTILDLIQEPLRHPLANPVLEVLHQHRSLELPPDCLLVARDGSEHPVGDNAAPIQDAQGQTRGAVLVFRDTTLQKQLAAERLRAQKLESLGLLAGGIAHDFNNALLGILGHVSLAKMETAPEEQAYQHLARAEQGVDRAVSLTKRLLTFAKGGAPIKQALATAAYLEEAVTFALQGGECPEYF